MKKNKTRNLNDLKLAIVAVFGIGNKSLLAWLLLASESKWTQPQIYVEQAKVVIVILCGSMIFIFFLLVHRSYFFFLFFFYCAPKISYVSRVHSVVTK